MQKQYKLHFLRYNLQLRVVLIVPLSSIDYFLRVTHLQSRSHCIALYPLSACRTFSHITTHHSLDFWFVWRSSKSYFLPQWLNPSRRLILNRLPTLFLFWHLSLLPLTHRVSPSFIQSIYRSCLCLAAHELHIKISNIYTYIYIYLFYMRTCICLKVKCNTANSLICRSLCCNYKTVFFIRYNFFCIHMHFFFTCLMLQRGLAM